jgi:hypothetical protein
MKNLIKQLYESGINLQFGWFWDAGFNVKIGDDMNGFVAEFSDYDIDKVLKWIEENVKKHFPGSGFDKTYKGETFESVTEPLMKYLSENHHPHTMVEVESNKATLWEGQKSNVTDKFILD